jgi:hypothetical protein
VVSKQVNVEPLIVPPCMKTTIGFDRMPSGLIELLGMLSKPAPRQPSADASHLKTTGDYFASI